MLKLFLFDNQNYSLTFSQEIYAGQIGFILNNYYIKGGICCLN